MEQAQRLIKYQALRFFAVLQIIVGFIAVGVSAFIVLAVGTMQTGEFTGIAFAGMFLITFGSICFVLMDIEENTRKV